MLYFLSYVPTTECNEEPHYHFPRGMSASTAVTCLDSGEQGLLQCSSYPCLCAGRNTELTQLEMPLPYEGSCSEVPCCLACNVSSPILGYEPRSFASSGRCAAAMRSTERDSKRLKETKEDLRRPMVRPVVLELSAKARTTRLEKSFLCEASCKAVPFYLACNPFLSILGHEPWHHHVRPFSTIALA